MAATPFPTTVPTVKLYRGDTTVWPSYIFKDDAGDPINLSGYSWAAQWRATPDATEMVALSVDTSQATVGQLTPSATSLQTAALSSGVWDLQSTSGSTVRTWIRGQVLVEEDVTRV